MGALGEPPSRETFASTHARMFKRVPVADPAGAGWFRPSGGAGGGGAAALALVEGCAVARFTAATSEQSLQYLPFTCMSDPYVPPLPNGRASTI
jgi:hypothetical protein